ncbi:hypothetical protein HPG69_016243 [Diceros bicornis minor]|uniref:Uncharacterized protein n=1 Tax=Diceros bicornis minor TaxID=77932 RepID=A0A7J7ELG4_DICBM|nr:hypothetical protein HPG69_016243 [Diceros bicornis minor]
MAKHNQKVEIISKYQTRYGATLRKTRRNTPSAPFKVNSVPSPCSFRRGQLAPPCHPLEDPQLSHTCGVEQSVIWAPWEGEGTRLANQNLQSSQKPKRSKPKRPEEQLLKRMSIGWGG